MLETHKAETFGANAAGKQLSESWITSFSIMIPNATFVRRKMDAPR